MILAVYSLWRRELVRFLRRPNGAVSALALPVVLFLSSSAIDRRSYELVAAFTLILATLAAIDDPPSEFLQGVLVSPAPRVFIVLAKAKACLTIAALNTLILWLLRSIR